LPGSRAIASATISAPIVGMIPSRKHQAASDTITPITATTTSSAT
jgi:hypothetical protein